MKPIFKIQEHDMDLEKGKQIFLKFGVSRFHIDRECPDEYKKCRVPKILNNSG